MFAARQATSDRGVISRLDRCLTTGILGRVLCIGLDKSDCWGQQDRPGETAFFT